MLHSGIWQVGDADYISDYQPGIPVHVGMKAKTLNNKNVHKSIIRA